MRGGGLLGGLEREELLLHYHSEYQHLMLF